MEILQKNDGNKSIPLNQKRAKDPVRTGVMKDLLSTLRPGAEEVLAPMIENNPNIMEMIRRVRRGSR